MPSQMYQVVLRATGEVRDADGNLLNPVEAEGTHVMSEDELRTAGFSDEQIAKIKEQNR